MTKIAQKLLAAALFAGLASMTQAAPIEGSFTPASTVTLSSGATPYAFSISLAGFDPLSDILESATISFNVSGAGGHNLSIFADGLSLFNAQLNALAPITLSATILAALQSDGALNITIAKTSGPTANSFTFTGASLTAEPQSQEAPVSSVPEPGTLALLGLGLLGGVLVRRRNT